MVAETLTDDDLDLILTSLSFTRRAFQDHPYDSYEFRREQLARVDSVAEKMRRIRDATRTTRSNG